METRYYAKEFLDENKVVSAGQPLTLAHRVLANGEIFQFFSFPTHVWD